MTSTPSEIIASANNDREPPGRLVFLDYLLLVLFCTLLFGYVAIDGRPMTLHEARLPETSREMLARNDWLLPLDGARPWLERPPFPHWCMMAVAKLIHQHCDNEWSARIPPALAGLLIVLMTARIAAQFFGRTIGVLSGFLLASMWEFYEYSTQPEDDIFLALLVVAAIALFVRMEFPRDAKNDHSKISFFGLRPLTVVGFFIFLGLTNLAKGPFVGAAVVIATIVAWFLMPTLLWQNESLSFTFHFQPDIRLAVRRYLWLWGILLAAAVGLSWHIFIARLYPGVGGYLDNLHYDFSMTHEFDEPWWYYPVNLLSRDLPWIPAAIFALFLTAKAAWIQPNRAIRFLWCWAIVPIIVLSIPHRKHHHYLVPSLAPWAILSAIGLKTLTAEMFKGPLWAKQPRFGLIAVGLPVSIAIAILAWRRLLSPDPAVHPQIISAAILIALLNACVLLFYIGLSKTNARLLLISLLIGFGGAYSWAQTHLRDGNVPDTAFLRNDVEAVVPKTRPLAIDAGIGPLDFFRVQFYLRPSAILLHNLTYLRSNQIHGDDIFIVARSESLPQLQTLGHVDMLSQSPRPIQKGVPHLALFHLIFSPGLQRFPPPPVNPMQAMMRQDGPWCGPPIQN